MSVRNYEEHAASVPLIKPARERDLSAAVNGTDPVARDLAIVELVEGNMRLVLKHTRRFRAMPDYEDILFDGNLGLVNAARSFNSDKGRFTTWATPQIKTEIREGILLRSFPFSGIRSAMEVVAGKAGRTRDQKMLLLASLATMDTIPLHDDEGHPIDVIDHEAPSAAGLCQTSDLLDIVMKAVADLGLSEDDVRLVSGEEGFAAKVAAKRGVGQSNMRMRRTRLIWLIRRKILEHVGKAEFVALSDESHLPGKSWR